MKLLKHLSANLHGRHCICIHADFNRDKASYYLQGNYRSYKALLTSLAFESPYFGEALLEAACEYAEAVADQEDDATT